MMAQLLGCMEELGAAKREIDRLSTENERLKLDYDSAAMQAAERMSHECQLLRAKLEKAQASALDWAARCGETQAQLEKVTDELFDLRAELAFRPTAITCAGKHGHITVIIDCPECVNEELAKAQGLAQHWCDLRQFEQFRAEAAEARIKELNTIIEASWAKAFEDDKEITRLKLALSEAHKKYNDSLIHATNAEQYLSGKIVESHINGMGESARIVRQRAVHTRGERELLEEVSAALLNHIKELQNERGV